MGRVCHAKQSLDDTITNMKTLQLRETAVRPPGPSQGQGIKVLRELVWFSAGLKLANDHLENTVDSNCCALCTRELEDEASKDTCIDALCLRLDSLEDRKKTLLKSVLSHKRNQLNSSNINMNQELQRGKFFYMRELKKAILHDKACPGCRKEIQADLGFVLSNIDKVTASFSN